MPEQALNLDRHHRHYEAALPIREEARHLCSNSRTVRSLGDRYLFKTQGEVKKPALYEFRLSRAVYDPWPTVIVDTRMSYIWRKEPVRALPPSIAGFIANVDGKGTHANVFFKRVTELAATEGLCWVFVDKPPLPERATKADEKKEKARPYMSIYNADDVLDWDFDKFGNVKWAVIREIVEVKPGPGAEAKEIEYRLVWDSAGWQWYQRQEPQGRQSKTWVPTEKRGTHKLGTVPIVPFYGIRLTDGLGEPITLPAHDHAKEIYNSASDRRYNIWQSNRPIPVQVGGNKSVQVEMAYEDGWWIEPHMHDKSAPIAMYLEPTGVGIQHSRDEERDLIRRIFEIALKQNKLDTKQVEAADTQHANREVYSYSLPSVAAGLEGSELSVWKLMAAWQGSAARLTDDAVQYNRDFDSTEATEAVVRVLSEMADKGQISTETLWKMLRSREWLPDDFNAEEEKLAIQQDMEARAMPTFEPNMGTQKLALAGAGAT